MKILIRNLLHLCKVDFQRRDEALAESTMRREERLEQELAALRGILERIPDRLDRLETSLQGFRETFAQHQKQAVAERENLAQGLRQIRAILPGMEKEIKNMLSRRIQNVEARHAELATRCINRTDKAFQNISKLDEQLQVTGRRMVDRTDAALDRQVLLERELQGLGKRLADQARNWSGRFAKIEGQSRDFHERMDRRSKALAARISDEAARLGAAIDEIGQRLLNRTDKLAARQTSLERASSDFQKRIITRSDILSSQVDDEKKRRDELAGRVADQLKNLGGRVTEIGERMINRTDGLNGRLSKLEEASREFQKRAIDRAEVLAGRLDREEEQRRKFTTRMESRTNRLGEELGQIRENSKGLGHRFQKKMEALDRRLNKSEEEASILRHRADALNRLDPVRQDAFSAFQKEQARELRFLKPQLRFSIASVLDRPDPWLSRNRNRHEGESCVLLGCGPSLKSVDFDLLRGRTVMGVNGTAFLSELELTYFVSVSNFFYKDHLDALRDFPCHRRFLPHFLHPLRSRMQTSWLNTVEDRHYALYSEEKPFAFSLEADRKVFLGGTVIFVCLQILYFLGFEQVILLGVDHDYGLKKRKTPKKGLYVKGKDLDCHFTDSYYSPERDVHIDLYAMDRAYRLAEKAFRQDGRHIINATENTKLTTFEKQPLKKILKAGQ